MHGSILNLTIATAFIACFIAPFYANRIPLLDRLPWKLSAALYLALIAVAAVSTWFLVVREI